MAGLLPYGYRMAAVPPGITSAFKKKESSKAKRALKPNVFPFY